MAPAGLSILTTSFNSGDDRNRALGVWGAISGLAAAAGVFLGGVLSQGPGWRWVLFVNLPVCALILAGAFRLVPGGRPAARPAGFDIPGAVLATGGMLLLVYALVQAPEQGWGSARTIGELATAAVVLAAFTATELRRRDPLFPFSIFRVKGLAAADARSPGVPGAMVTRKGMTTAHEDIKGAVAGAIKARLAAAQPLAEVL